jgi:hypothetical protein
MDRRTFLAAAAAAPLAAVAPRALASAEPAPANLIGYTADGSLTADELDTLTARAARAVRVYHVAGTPVPDNAAAARILPHLRAGREVVLSLKVPDSSTQTAARCAALAADIATLGHAAAVRIVLWHEPYPELTAAAYTDRYTALAPAIRGHGLACGVCFHTYPIWHKDLDYTTYWPGDDLTDFLAIDTYPPDAPGGQGFTADPLATIAPLTSFAKNHGKTFGIAEVGANTSLDPAGADAWLRRFTRLGRSCRFVLYFNGPALGLETNGGALLPAYQALYDRFALPAAERGAAR